jgi:hypothetical protein
MSGSSLISDLIVCFECFPAQCSDCLAGPLNAEAFASGTVSFTRLRRTYSNSGSAAAAAATFSSLFANSSNTAIGGIDKADDKDARSSGRSMDSSAALAQNSVFGTAPIAAMPIVWIAKRFVVESAHPLSASSSSSWSAAAETKQIVVAMDRVDAMTVAFDVRTTDFLILFLFAWHLLLIELHAFVSFDCFLISSPTHLYISTTIHQT